MRFAIRGITAAGAAAILGVHKSTVTRWIAAGKLPAQRSPGGHYRIRPSDVAKMERRQRGCS